MKELSYDEYRYWKCDNVVAVTIDRDAIKAFGFIDLWQDALYDRADDPFHILLLERDCLGEPWILNRETVCRHGFSDAISELAECRCGGMCFEHEEDHEKMNACEDLYLLFASTCEIAPRIVWLQENEYAEFLRNAQGPYIVIEDKHGKNEK